MRSRALPHEIKPSVVEPRGPEGHPWSLQSADECFPEHLLPVSNEIKPIAILLAFGPYYSPE
jgi:hypothetical protein